MAMSVGDSSSGNCGGRSEVAIVFAWDARFTEGGSRASLSLHEPAFGVPSTLVAAPSSGAEVGHGEVPREVVASIER